MQVPATVLIGDAGADDELDGVGLGAATAAGELPALALGVALAAASGAGIEVGAGLQVLTSVVTGTGFGVGTTLPIGGAVPPVDTAGLADGAAEVDDWFGVVLGARLGLTVVVRLGGATLL